MSILSQHSPGDVIRWALVAAGLGSDPLSEGGDWPAVVSLEPDTPDNSITVFDTSSTSDGREMVGGEIQEHPGFQIRVRSMVPTVGYQKCLEIRRYLSEEVYEETVTVDGLAYLLHCVSGIGSVMYLGREVPQSRRSIHTLNALAVVTPLYV